MNTRVLTTLSLWCGFFVLMSFASGLNAADQELEGKSGLGLGLGRDLCIEHPYSIALEVHNVRKAVGVITVDLHDDNPDGFLNKTGLVSRIRQKAEKDVTQICIPVKEAGTFAIAIYHDKDANQKFNKNWLGIPSEPYGISNDPKIGLSAPPHHKAAFQVNGPGTPAKITLRGK